MCSQFFNGRVFVNFYLLIIGEISLSVNNVLVSITQLMTAFVKVTSLLNFKLLMK